jgi:hypothetical protein
MKATLLIGFLIILCTCGTEEQRASREVITFWHFWSEPEQTAALSELITTFERQNPGVDVQLVPLQWSDGRAKLQLAFNSNTAPHIVHLGVDWFPQFANAGVFEALPDSFHLKDAPFTSALVGPKGKPVGTLWCINARALLIDSMSPAPPGFCVNDPHNVIKRTLPFIWSFGAPRLGTSLPVWQTLDQQAVLALDSFRIVAHKARLDKASLLDKAILQGSISTVITGSWMIRSLPPQWAVSPSSQVLNGDVLAVTTGSASPTTLRLLSFLRSFEQARAFTDRVIDAGFPADIKQLANISFPPMREGFKASVLTAIELPTSPNWLSIEEELERLINTCAVAQTRDQVLVAVSSTRQRLMKLEK